MRSKKSILILLSMVVLFLSACAQVGKPEITSDRDEDSEGARLYALHCSACHGNYGRGGVGVPLALEDFLKSVSNQYIAQSIRFGRPGRVMPTFPRLSDQQVQVITEYIRTFHWADEPKFSIESIKGNPKFGAKLYTAYCAQCHGAKGEGGHGTGVSFSRPRFKSILAPALNNEGYLASANDQVIKHSLTLGRAGTPMRALSTMGLSEQNINDLVSYIRSFQILSVKRFEMKRPAEAALVWPSSHSYEQTIERLKDAVVNNGYSVVREQLLGEGIVDPDEGERKQHVVYFASLQMISDGLAHDPRMGLFLPGKIIIIEHEGVVKVLAHNPKQYNALFNNTALSDFSEMLHKTYQAILLEATL
ncbi:c-type cytochrome [Pseudomonadota bacterium]